MKVTSITHDPTTGEYLVEVDETWACSVGLVPPDFGVGDEVELSIRKSIHSGGIEQQAQPRSMGSPTSEPEAGFVRTPDGKSDWHI